MTVQDLRRRIHEQLIDELGPVLADRRVTDADLKRRVQDHLHSALIDSPLQISARQKAQLLQDVADDVLGYGPIDRLLKDPDVSEVMVNGPGAVYIERNGRLERSEVRFADDAHLRRVIDKMVGQIGRRVDEATPYCDARLPDGSRVNAVIHPLAIDGPFLTVRKFAVDPYGIEDLIAFGTLTPAAARLLEAAVRGRMNVVVSGGTGTGKTTTLNVLSSFIPADERIITVEDAKELQLHQEHVLSMESRPPNIEGRGEVTIRDLVRNALRMRPDRIVVGECRGGEALDMLQAMNTGHDGSLTTVHANSPRDVLSRLETLILMAGFDLPLRAIREQVSAAIDLVIQLTRFRDGSRRVTHIAEVHGMELDTIVLQDLFRFDHAAGIGQDGRALGVLRPTGIRPRLSERLEQRGIGLDAAIFTEPAAAATSGRRRR